MNRQQKLEYHDNWLRRMGVHPTQLKSQPKYRAPLPDYSVSETLPTSDRVGNGFVRGKSRYTLVKEFLSVKHTTKATLSCFRLRRHPTQQQEKGDEIHSKYINDTY